MGCSQILYGLSVWTSILFDFSRTGDCRCWQFLSLRDIFPQLFSQCKIDLSSDLHWLWGALVILTLPEINTKFLPTLELMTGECTWEWHEMRYPADNSGLFVLFFVASFRFHFLFPFLHAVVPDLTSWAHACLWAALKGFVKSDQRKETYWKIQIHCRVPAPWTEKWLDTCKSLKSSEYNCYREWDNTPLPGIWTVLFLAVKPDVGCLCLFSELEPKHVHVPSKKRVGQLGCNFIAELGDHCERYL